MAGYEMPLSLYDLTDAELLAKQQEASTELERCRYRDYFDRLFGGTDAQYEKYLKLLSNQVFDIRQEMRRRKLT